MALLPENAEFPKIQNPYIQKLAERDNNGTDWIDNDSTLVTSIAQLWYRTWIFR